MSKSQYARCGQNQGCNRGKHVAARESFQEHLRVTVYLTLRYFFVIVHLHNFKSYQSFCENPTVIWSYMYKNLGSLWSPLLTIYGHDGTGLLRSSQCTFHIVVGNARDEGASRSEPSTKTCILFPAVRKEVSAED